MENNIVLFESADHKAQLNVELSGTTVWLTQEQMSELFGRTVSSISRHISNAIKEGEISEKAICKKCKLAAQISPLRSMT